MARMPELSGCVFVSYTNCAITRSCMSRPPVLRNLPDVSWMQSIEVVCLDGPPRTSTRGRTAILGWLRHHAKKPIRHRHLGTHFSHLLISTTQASRQK